jgi:hypothetical protein
MRIEFVVDNMEMNWQMLKKNVNMISKIFVMILIFIKEVK